MSLLNFSKANCKNCYKCLRECPVKAIKFKNQQAEIVEERCIGCGHCLVVCPQDARNIKSDLPEIKKMIFSEKKVIASIAPSFIASFNNIEAGQFVAGLKKMGFHIVEETAIGAEIVVDLYDEYIKKSQENNIITSCCPSVNYLIERYFPSLTEHLIPIVSPMLAHGKKLKHQYGMESYVVFIGPCTGKKIEALNIQHKGTIDAVLTFEELGEWFKSEGIILNTLEAQEFDNTSTQRGRSFPLKGGVIGGLYGKHKKYDPVKIDGINECLEIFRSMEAGNINNVLLEANVCRGSCLNGPCMIDDGIDYYQRQNKVREYIQRKNKNIQHYIEPLENINFRKLFFDRHIERKIAREEDLKKILRTIGKYKVSDELNCGGCGYNTCREKAQAVFEGMAEVNMCLPFMRGKAERLTNVIFENSPNIIMIVDDDMTVKEFNPTAERVFNIKQENIVGNPVTLVIDDENFEHVKETKKSIFAIKKFYPQYNVILLQNILYLEEQNVMLAIMINMTEAEKHKGELKKVRQNAIEAAQRVIEKQMIVAQEIASLLGETTAETKVTLTKLKEIAIEEAGDIE